MTGYVITHEGNAFDPDGKVTVDDAKGHNAALEQQELAFLATKPERAMCYITETDGHLRATTWLGTEIGRVVSSNVTRNNLTGSKMRSVRINVNGAIYYGSYGCEWSQLVRLRRAK